MWHWNNMGSKQSLLTKFGQFMSYYKRKIFIYQEIRQKLPGVDTGCFQHQYTDFGHTNLGMPKFYLKKNLNYH